MTVTAPEVPPERVRELASGLADELEKAGDLTSPAWRQAVETVPRHLFLPRFYRYEPARHECVPVDSADPAQRQEWLRAAYQNRTWVTRVDDHHVDDDGSTVRYGRPTSSGTLPGLLVRMAELSGTADGDRVLEIGTGTGYFAALLCARLGDRHVTTVDVDPYLVEAARQRLAAAGYRPTVVLADGRDGHAGNAPYDRVIATCSVRPIPSAWVTQTRPGGTILTTLAGTSAMVRLTAHGSEQASGRVLPDYASFMASRPAGPIENGPYERLFRQILDGVGPGEQAGPMPDLLGDWAFRFVAELALPGLDCRRGSEEDGSVRNWLLAADGSWAIHTAPADGPPTVVEGGPRRIWSALADCHAAWVAHDSPRPEEFHVTVEPAGQQVVLPGGGLSYRLD